MSNKGGMESGKGGFKFNGGIRMTEEEVKNIKEQNELREKLLKESETARGKVLKEKNID